MDIRLEYLDLISNHSKVKIKFMHISTQNISEMVTDRVNITNAIKYEVTSGLSISIFRFDLEPF